MIRKEITPYGNNPENIRECYFNENNEIHNENGPACLFFDKDNWLCVKQFGINGQYHNENGPAYIRCDKDIITDKAYYLNGKHFLNIKNNKQWKFYLKTLCIQ